MIQFLSPVLYGAKFLFKTGLGLVAPWLKPLIDRPVLIICLGLSVMAGAYLLRVSGKQAVVADVASQAKELHAKDAAENLELAIDQEQIAADVRAAEKALNQMKKRVKDETYSEAKEWANQPLPASVLERLRGQ